MKEQCFDEGTIQAFLDGELASGMLENVARHVALCDDCAMLLAETEEESAFAFAALDELNALVPTERIRTNVYQAISEIEKPKTSFWEKITSFSFILSNPSITAFAGLLIVAGLFAVVWEFNDRTTVSTTEIAQKSVVNQPQSKGTSVIPVSQPTEPVNVAAQSQTISQDPALNRPKIINADYRPKYQTAKFTQAPKTKVETPATTTTAPAEILSGEDTYLKTIATLKKTVDGSKDMILDPSSRVAYEKDMAMVNYAIDKMRTEVRKNPKNEVAKEVLRSSYQNKINLLNSVAERTDLVAGLE